MKNSCLSVIVYQQYFINSALLYVYLSSNKQKPHDCIITKKCHCMVDSCSKHLLIYFDQDFVSPTHIVKLLALCLNSYYSPWAVFHQRTLQCLFLYNKWINGNNGEMFYWWCHNFCVGINIISHETYHYTDASLFQMYLICLSHLCFGLMSWPHQ